jgi:hypothetical protein
MQVGAAMFGTQFSTPPELDRDTTPIVRAAG